MENMYGGGKCSKSHGFSIGVLEYYNNYVTFIFEPFIFA